MCCLVQLARVSYSVPDRSEGILRSFWLRTSGIERSEGLEWVESTLSRFGKAASSRNLSRRCGSERTVGLRAAAPRYISIQRLRCGAYLSAANPIGDEAEHLAGERYQPAGDTVPNRSCAERNFQQLHC